MKKGVFIAIGTAVILLIIFVIVFPPGRISCDNQIDCLEKHFEKCKKYETTLEGKTAAIVDFGGLVTSKWKILGEKAYNGCKIMITINSVTNENESWAVGKSAICYLNIENFDDGDVLGRVEQNCEGDFATGVIEHCYYIGGSDRTRCDGPLEVKEEEVFVANLTLDPENACGKLNDNLKDQNECLDTLKGMKDGIEIDVLLCEQLYYASDMQRCIEAAEEFDSYIVYYYSMVKEYRDEGYNI